MIKTSSPLRYPGGKTSLCDMVASILHSNRLQATSYAEPYAGGCGLALSLLFGGHVSDIQINDIDPCIWAFWHAVLNRNEELVALIMTTPVTVEEWLRQKEIHRQKSKDDVLALGFSTFFLNRTNRSGVIQSGGVIGGLDQKGNYKIDCRFNREGLARRVQRIAKYRNRITLTNYDGVAFMKERDTAPSSVFFCIDPPYFGKGSSLYTNYYGPSEHSAVASTVLGLRNPWIVTYDDCPEIRELYKERKQNAFDIQYSVQTKRLGGELLISSRSIVLPEKIRVRPPLALTLPLELTA